MTDLAAAIAELRHLPDDQLAARIRELTSATDPDTPAPDDPARATYLADKARANRYIPIRLEPKQMAFVTDERKEALFGGAGGSGKSYSLLAAALLHVDTPGYHALLLRRAYTDLSLPGALMDVVRDWLQPTDAKEVQGGRSWLFPSGASLTLSYLATERQKTRYASAAFSFVGFDELSTFTQTQYEFLFTRIRQSNEITARGIPLRMRSASNPAPWVKRRFVDPHPEGACPDPETCTFAHATWTPDRVFIPAAMADNPHLDADAYRSMLAETDPVTRAQIEDGNWDIRPQGNYFKAEKIRYSPGPLPGESIRCRSWDFAATEAKKGKDPDWAVGALVAFHPHTGRWRVEDIVRVQEDPDDLERTIQATASRDGTLIPILIEQEPGASGKLSVRDFQKRVLAGYPVHAITPTGSKLLRAGLTSSLVSNGLLDFTRAEWNGVCEDEFIPFPSPGVHDDQVDAVSQACHWLSAKSRMTVSAARPQGSRDQARTGRLPMTQRRLER